ncbi:MAG: DUF5009 domain-containing protein [Flavihumibacter sp.]
MQQLTEIRAGKRLLSLDVMRGLIMIFLAAEEAGVYTSLQQLTTEGSWSYLLVQQFFHHPWNGLRVWDLVQPAFMTMAGSALYISTVQKAGKGTCWAENFRHVLLRCVKLFFLGIVIHCVYRNRLTWELWNVLTQLSVTTVIAYFIIRKGYAYQIAVCVVLLLLTECLYRFTHIPGYDQPFVNGHNFGNYMDKVLMGKINEDGWVAINALPTAVHTIAGVLAGKLFLEPLPDRDKIKKLLAVAGLCLLLGYGLDWLHITPIIKRIATSAFTLASLGWVFIAMAVLYWIHDIRQLNRYAWIAVAVGTNAIFLYMFFSTVGWQWFNGFTGIFVKGGLELVAVPEAIRNLVSALVVLLLEWYICYFLYKKKVFIKL